METEKEADDQFIDGQSLGKKHKREFSNYYSNEINYYKQVITKGTKKTSR